jgi:hypothetical protein
MHVFFYKSSGIVYDLVLLSVQYLLDLKEGKWSYIDSKGEKPSPRTGQTATLLDDGRILVFGGSSMTDGLVFSTSLRC